MDQNLITRTEVSGYVLNVLRGAITANHVLPLTLTPHDPAYFFARVNPRLRLRDQGFGLSSRAGEFITSRTAGRFGPDPFAPVQINWKRVPAPIPTMGVLRDEIKFLEGMGLAMLVPDSADEFGSELYIVSPRIATLYAEGTGPTGTDGQGVFIAVDTNKELKARQFIKLLVHYILPGMYWRNYYVTDGLAPHIHLTEKLGREMLEIGAVWDRLVTTFGWPVMPFTAEDNEVAEVVEP